MTKYNPVSTYRFQFNKNFKLNDAERLLPYLKKTGIKTIYASPVFQAVKGSMHGYDVTNPLKINTEIGTEKDFENLIRKIHDYEMGWIQDIVPNHMAFSTENPWIFDVLKKGKQSLYFEFFDIRENHPDKNLKDKLMLPFFGKPLNQLIEDKELSVGFDDTGFTLNYFDSHYPVSVPAYPKLLKAGKSKPVPAVVTTFLNADKNIENFYKHREELFTEPFSSEQTKAYLHDCTSAINNDSEKLKEIIANLYYFPSFWKDTEQKINYRRFFTINGLICVNVQNKKVFDLTHKLIASWIERKMIDGIRIDHIDGLFNPAEYLDRLRKLTGNNFYISVEKILEKDEKLPVNWPVEGTTGYDFLGMINNLLTNPKKGPLFYSYYNDWTDRTDNFTDVFYRKNRFILCNRLRGELDNLTRECLTISSITKQNQDERNIHAAIGKFLVFCPVYKIYNSPTKFTDKEKNTVTKIIKKAAKTNEENKRTLNILLHLFLLELPGSETDIPKIDIFFRHCMQFTGPLMAKGIEDTAFYSYNPFICHNEVGDSPGYFGIHTEKFHDYMKERQEKHPLTMNAISTHDTKRGEDARARLNVLSDIPEKWMEVTNEWRKLNGKFKQEIAGKEVPTPNDEYLIYQVLCAHLPMDAKISESFKKRLQNYLVKAMREAKVNSSWSDPDEKYENATLDFVQRIVEDKAKFHNRFLLFMKNIITHGIINSVTQLILKNTTPGVADTFQGTEEWNLSFVDPDNRRPVNYFLHAENLQSQVEEYKENAFRLASKVWQNPVNGELKQWATWLTLNERIKYPNLFLKGNYIPLKITGRHRKNIIAFYRHWQDEYLAVILPLNTAGMPAGFKWGETEIEFPKTAPLNWENRLTKNKMKISGKLDITDIFTLVPFGILRNI